MRISTPHAYLVPFEAREGTGNCGTIATDDCLPNPSSPQEQQVFFNHCAIVEVPAPTV